MTKTTYTVDGMTCAACLGEVMDRVRTLPGVIGVAVRYLQGAPSPLLIESRDAVAPEALRETLEQAGFHVGGTSRRHDRRLQRAFATTMPDAPGSVRKAGAPGNRAVSRARTARTLETTGAMT